ncbi:hypothetical protein [uncultured Acinetobacter sp.]|uniref:hypothetical protein n=1 Tax=uncultured Acinetobacter sp. TaxID=165433 RepID=UPI00260DD902|nr:hypothetical protein [uncultured Acinetobacter sp.]
MSSITDEELRIIEALSSVNIPDEVFRNSNISYLVDDMIKDQTAVDLNSKKLAQLFLSNQEEGVVSQGVEANISPLQEKSTHLKELIENLEKKSSQLLIINITLSKVINDQQKNLLSQKNQLIEQQQQVDTFGQRLVETEKIVKKQTKELADFSLQLLKNEKKIEDSSNALIWDLEQKIYDSNEQCLDQLNAGFAEQQEFYNTFEQEIMDFVSDKFQEVKDEQESLSTDIDETSVKLENKLKEFFSSDINESASKLEEQLKECFYNDINQVTSKLEEQLKECFYNDINQVTSKLEEQLKEDLDLINKNNDEQSLVFSEKIEKEKQGLKTKIEAVSLIAEDTANKKIKNIAMILQRKINSQQAQQKLLADNQKKLLASLESKFKKLKTINLDLLKSYNDQKVSNKKINTAMIVTAGLALVSIGWQIVSLF